MLTKTVHEQPEDRCCPAMFKLNGTAICPVGRESDKALALLQSLDEKQRNQAVLTYNVPDLVLGPGQDDA
jgi:hypothetical protein